MTPEPQILLKMVWANLHFGVKQTWAMHLALTHHLSGLGRIIRTLGIPVLLLLGNVNNYMSKTYIRYPLMHLSQIWFTNISIFLFFQLMVTLLSTTGPSTFREQ